jgi:seryl-tRNA synthetase
MHDIRAIGLDPDAYDTGWAKRGGSPAASALIALDEARRAAQTALQQAQSRRNEASTLIGRA